MDEKALWRLKTLKKRKAKCAEIDKRLSEQIRQLVEELTPQFLDEDVKSMKMADGTVFTSKRQFFPRVSNPSLFVDRAINEPDLRDNLAIHHKRLTGMVRKGEFPGVPSEDDAQEQGFDVKAALKEWGIEVYEQPTISVRGGS